MSPLDTPFQFTGHTQNGVAEHTLSIFGAHRKFNSPGIPFEFSGHTPNARTKDHQNAPTGPDGGREVGRVGR